MSFKTGKKTVELRRRSVQLPPGTTVWIYSKVPKGSIDLLGTVDQVISATPENLWRKFGTRTGISKAQFNTYFRNSAFGSAIILREIKRLSPTVELGSMREISNGFQPPQFLKFLDENSPELKLLKLSRRLPTGSKRNGV